MGGKGGGGGSNYYQAPVSSEWGSPEAAAATLARTAPIDMSNYQQTINARKAAAAATAPQVEETVAPDMPINEVPPQANTPPPGYWTEQNRLTALKPRPLGPHADTTIGGALGGSLLNAPKYWVGQQL